MVNRALRELADEGYLEHTRKSGTRVLNFPIRRAQFPALLVRDEIATTGAPYRYAQVERKALAAPPWLVGRLGLGSSQQVLHV